MNLLYGQDDFVRGWVAQRIGNPKFSFSTTIGVTRGDELIAGIVIHNYIESPIGEPIMCEISMAATDKRWATRPVMRAVFGYCFNQLGVKRVQVCTPVESKNVRIVNEKLGFKYEGTARQAHYLGGDIDVLSMLRDECKWIS
ncbi:MAG: GNAT family N-acetyltransferase [Patescibacteria group bacterium]|nr:GNAT family N-acetyltransferase [Patescibacteria group bacterium]